MKKIFTTLALAAASLTPAMAALDFNGAVIDPQQGTVTSLKTITVTFPNITNTIDINSRTDIVLDVNGIELNTTKVTGINDLTVTIPEEQTSPGIYTLTIGEYSLTGYDEEYNMVDNPAMSFSWTIEGNTEPDAFEYEIVSPTGELSSLEEIRIKFTKAEEIEINSYNDIQLMFGDTPLEGEASYSLNNLIMTLDKPATAPGEYNLVIKPYAICGYGTYDPVNDEYPYLGDNPQEIVIPFTVVAHGVDFSFTANPKEGSPLQSLETAELTFTNLDKVLADEDLITVDVNGSALDKSKYTVTSTGDDNKVIVAFNPAINAQASTSLKINFPVNSLLGQKGSDDGMNEEALELNYTIEPSAVYDLVFALSSPTKPNADGEISAEKQLLSFFFNVPLTGCDVGDLTDNVTIKEVNGDFERTATLNKASGLDMAHYSYFSADFGAEPQYNGEYEITIAKGSAGNASWLTDHNIGRSNDLCVLRFTLVDGRDRDVNNIQPLSVTPAEGSYTNAADLKTVTVTFADGIDAAPDAFATLAGVDNTYLASATFVKQADGSFAATFDTLPTEFGNYIMTINAGAFGDADFLADNTQGHGSVEIIRNYAFTDTSAISGINADSNDVFFFNLQGNRIAEPKPGEPYIRVANGTATKSLR